MRSEHPELAGPLKRCLGALDAVSWPWIPVLGSLEPPRRDGENAQKTGKNGEQMGEIRSKTCKGVGITCELPDEVAAGRHPVVVPTPGNINVNLGFLARRFSTVSDRFSRSWCRFPESWRQDGENGEKTGEKRGKMGEKWPKKSGGKLT